MKFAQGDAVVVVPPALISTIGPAAPAAKTKLFKLPWALLRIVRLFAALIRMPVDVFEVQLFPSTRLPPPSMSIPRSFRSQVLPTTCELLFARTPLEPLPCAVQFRMLLPESTRMPSSPLLPAVQSAIVQ